MSEHLPQRHADCKIIDRLGGTAAVARLARVSIPAVSQWRRAGIPAARRMYLEAVRPDAFAPLEPAVAQPAAA